MLKRVYTKNNTTLPSDIVPILFQPLKRVYFVKRYTVVLHL